MFVKKKRKEFTCTIMSMITIGSVGESPKKQINRGSIFYVQWSHLCYVYLECVSSFQSQHKLDMEWRLPHLIVISKMKHCLQPNSACLFLSKKIVLVYGRLGVQLSLSCLFLFLYIIKVKICTIIMI